ncbi:MAG: hypothetical protein CV045_13895, partial [Cyanobacteria bacterium M5B4]
MRLPLDETVFRTIPDGDWVLWAWDVLTGKPSIQAIWDNGMVLGVPIQVRAVHIAWDTAVRKVVDISRIICNLLGMIQMLGGSIVDIVEIIVPVDIPGFPLPNNPLIDVICSPLWETYLLEGSVVQFFTELIDYGFIDSRLINSGRQAKRVLESKRYVLQSLKDAINSLPIIDIPGFNASFFSWARREIIRWFNETIKLINKMIDLIDSLIPILICRTQINPCDPYFFNDIILGLLNNIPTSLISYQELCGYPCIDAELVDRLYPNVSPQVKSKILRELRLAHSKVCHCTILNGCEDDDPRIPDREITCDDCEN